MATLKKFLAYMLGGAILGVVTASAVGLWLIPWYNSPGSGAQSVVDPAVFARSVIHSVLQGQLVGAGIGAVVLLVFGIALHRSGGKKESEQAALTTATAAAVAAAPVPARAAVKDGPPPM